MNTNLKIFGLIIFNLINLQSGNAQMYWNQAASFTGSSTGYVSVPNSSSVNITGSFTLEAWMNPSSFGPFGRGVIAKGGTFGTTLRYGIRILATGKVILVTNGTIRCTATTTLQTNTWTHVAATYNSSTNDFKIYINGIIDASSVIVAAAPITNTDSLFVGISGASTPYNGKLDEVRLWNRELSAEEVSKFMRTSLETSSGIYSGLVLSMTFQNPVSSSPYSFNDHSGNGNNGNGRNIIQVDQSFRPLHTISQNECVKFSGNDDYLAGKDTSALSPSPSLTIECWVYPELNQPMTIVKKGNSYELSYDGSRISAKLNGNNVTGLGIIAPLNRWSYYILSYDFSSSSLFFSLNGITFGGVLGSINIPANNDSIFVGGGLSENDFVGYIDELRITNKAIGREDFKDYMFTSIDVNNDPFPSVSNVNYSFDGNLSDNANNGGPELFFRNNARFSHPGQISEQPVSPLERNSNESFQKGFYIRKPFLTIPSLGSISDEVRINSDEPLTDVNLFLAINHQNSSDLDIYLIAPNGDSVRVFNNVSSNSTDNNIISIFDDNADSSLIDARYNSYYTKLRPSDNLNSAFNGDNPRGIWKLHINDTESGSTGILYAWGIQLNDQSERSKNLNLTCFLQGFYDAGSNLMVPDTIRINVRKKYSPYDIVESHIEVHDSIGIGRYSLSGNGNVNVDSGYILQIFHRNTIESWSGGEVQFSNYESNPNLSFASVSVFGSNSIKVDNSPVRFALYGGDVNQDGVVDATDLSLIDNDAFNFLTGYLNTDLTGDDVIDASDASIAENNAFNFVSAITP